MKISVVEFLGIKKKSKSPCKQGIREIGGQKHFYRSKWEMNYARYLEFLKQQKQIKKWEYEPECFWFLKIKRGVRSYLPDFRLTLNDDSQVWHEVKGYMDPRSKTKLKRMKKYYPKVKLEVIDEKKYYGIKRQLSAIIKGWE